MRFISDKESGQTMNVLADEKAWPIVQVFFIDFRDKTERMIECITSWAAHELCKEQGFYVNTENTWPTPQTDKMRWDLPLWQERERTEKEVLEGFERVKTVRARIKNPYLNGIVL